MKNKKIYKLYLQLLKRYGGPQKYRELIAIGAILTQRTSWRNADIALRNLKKNKLLSLDKIAELTNLNKLTKLVRPAGFFQTKPKRLYGLASFVVQKYGNLNKFAKEEIEIARNKLLNLYGIGPETADTIILYALDKPSFVIDEYTKRFVAKNLSLKNKNYDYLKKLFESNLPKKVEVYQNYHALIVVEQKGLKGSRMAIL